MSASDSGIPLTVFEALIRAARRFSEQEVVIYDRRGRNPERRTFGELLDSARTTASRLAGLGLETGDPVAICLPTSWAWLEAWSGAILLGALPLAMAPGPILGSSKEHVEKLGEVLSLIGGRHVVCPSRLQQEIHRLGALEAEVSVVTPEEVAKESAASRPRELAADPDGVAFLQLTSGTTGRSRAVMIRHRAATHNATAIGEAIGQPIGVSVEEFPDAAVVSWLPLFHDMGLVGCLLTGLLHGLEIHLIPSEAFLGRPRLWLESLSHLGRTVSAAPNFGYQLCVERLAEEEIAKLDLSRWMAALIGAEMVRSETMSAFYEKFRSSGFELGAFRPCYGMAEATLAVTMDHRAEGPRSRPAPSDTGAEMGLEEVISTGKPLRDTQVRATSPDGRTLPDGRIGEIRVKGPGVFAGYINEPDATAEALEDGWLRTGDLGFVEDGELYLTGRIKDVMIVHGHNLMPHELERIVEGVTGGGGAHRAGAFTIARGAEGEEIVLVAEVSTRDSGQLKEMADTIRSRIGRALGLPVADVAFVAGGRIAKTTSGKVRRDQLRRDYLRGDLSRIES